LNQHKIHQLLSGIPQSQRAFHGSAISHHINFTSQFWGSLYQPARGHEAGLALNNSDNRAILYLPNGLRPSKERP